MTCAGKLLIETGRRDESVWQFHPSSGGIRRGEATTRGSVKLGRRQGLAGWVVFSWMGPMDLVLP